MSVYMEGELARVSANHVIAVRIVPGNNGFVVQALTTDWSIDLCQYDNLDDATKKLHKLADDLRHQ